MRTTDIWAQRAYEVAKLAMMASDTREATAAIVRLMREAWTLANETAARLAERYPEKAAELIRQCDPNGGPL